MQHWAGPVFNLAGVKLHWSRVKVDLLHVDPHHSLTTTGTFRGKGTSTAALCWISSKELKKLIRGKDKWKVRELRKLLRFNLWGPWMLEANFTVNRSVVKKWNDFAPDQSAGWTPDHQTNKHSNPSSHAACVLKIESWKEKVTEWDGARAQGLRSQVGELWLWSNNCHPLNRRSAVRFPTPRVLELKQVAGFLSVQVSIITVCILKTSNLNRFHPVSVLWGEEGGSYGRHLVVEKHRKLLRVYQNWVELEAFLSSRLARVKLNSQIT